MQYSYLASWLALIAEPDYGADASRALFREIYGYWTKLPKESRPRLYLYGLSLGAMNSEQSTDLFEVLGDPFDGALWSGPPYSARLWRSITADRNPGSPAWLPRFRDGSFVRFMNQDGAAVAPGSVWGPMRIVYLQYASDPVTFFDYHDLYRQPDWMTPPRGPDVSPQLRWYPVVTLLQLLLDMVDVDDHADRLWSCVCAGALCRRLDRGDRCQRLVAERDRAAEATARRAIGENSAGRADAALRGA